MCVKGDKQVKLKTWRSETVSRSDQMSKQKAEAT
jgi:hypothetical protein